ncbi:MAG: bifunctional folylpolyglutamate synthase/dihydrofolate synthase [Bacteroidales bacterium]|nr:bifunctional folylpolyglutamate synthase/dihydrofolate synthase [Bacteroidales bacterium]
MNYNETIDFLFKSLPMYQRSGKAAYKANLDNTLALDKALGHPHRKFASIHIAGTNGKGSTSHILASVLQESGYKTGLYTSPHLFDFRERIRVNGLMIGKEEVVRFVQETEKKIREIQPSFFEMTVAMAFDHFAKEKTEIGIIETGMGGRLDSTNIIAPLASVVTNISLDHTEFLGNTEAEIAVEKGGIIKEGIPVITGNISNDIHDILLEIARNRQTTITRSDSVRNFKYQTATADQRSVFHFYNTISKENEAIITDLNGSYQQENIALALAVIDFLKRRGYNITPASISKGLENVIKNTGLRGRWDILGTNPRVIADTAHNEAGILAVINQLSQLVHRQLHIVWGMVSDKPAGKILRHLPKHAKYYFTEPSIPRAMPVNRLLQEANALGMKGLTYPGVAEALESAKMAAGPEDTIFIGGSTFVVADIKT